eukprot:g403.t1
MRRRPSSLVSSDTLQSINRKNPAQRKEFLELYGALKKLQLKYKEQENENEMQNKVIDEMRTQIQALRKAFKTMHTVFTEETEAINEDLNEKAEQIGTRVNQQENAIEELKKLINKHFNERLTREQIDDSRWKQLDALIVDVKNINQDVTKIGQVQQGFEEVDARARESLKRMEMVTSTSAHVGDWVQQLRAEVAQLQGAMLTLKEDYAISTSALAQDVAALAQDASTTRQNFTTKLEQAKDEWRVFQKDMEKSSIDVTRNLQQRLHILTKDIIQQIEQVRDSEKLLHRGHTKLRSHFQESISNVAAETRTVLGKMRALDTTLTSKLDEMERKLKEEEQNSERHNENIANAMQVFADTLHISSPYIRL